MITELIVGGLVTHLFPMPKQIEQTSFQANMVVKCREYNFLFGNNSIGKPIYGMGYDFYLTRHLSFKLGGYIQDRTEFEKIDVYIPFGDFLPIVGFEWDIPLNKTHDLTTVLMPHAAFLGISVNF